VDAVNAVVPDVIVNPVVLPVVYTIEIPLRAAVAAFAGIKHGNELVE